MQLNQYIIASTDSVGLERTEILFGTVLARGQSVDMSEGPSAPRGQQGFGRQHAETADHALARQLDAVINRRGSRTLAVRARGQNQANVSFTGISAFTDYNGLAVPPPAQGAEVNNALPSALTPREPWLAAQLEGYLQGVLKEGILRDNRYYCGSPNEAAEIWISLPWPVGSVRSSVEVPIDGSAELVLTARAGLMLRITGFTVEPFKVTASYGEGGRADENLVFVVQNSRLQDNQAMDIQQFEANVNGEVVGGWGYAGFTLVNPCIGLDEYGRIGQDIKGLSADDTTEAPILAPGTLQKTVVPDRFYPAVDLADTEDAVARQLVVNLYGLWVEV